MFSAHQIFLFLDYQTSRISQQIMATDGGNRSSSVDLTVIITNMHNQPPQWEQEEYWVTIPENTVRDSKIVVSSWHYSISTSFILFLLLKLCLVKSLGKLHVLLKNSGVIVRLCSYYQPEGRHIWFLRAVWIHKSDVFQIRSESDIYLIHGYAIYASAHLLGLPMTSSVSPL